MTFETLKAVATDDRIGPERTAAEALEEFAAEGAENLEPCLACRAGHPDT